MSRVIKASRIIGEYKIDDKIFRKEIESKPTGDVLEDEYQKKEEVKQADQQIKDQCTQIIETAKKEAQEIIDKAIIQAKKKQEEGFNQGYQEGFLSGQEEGKEIGLKKFKDLVAFFDDIIRKTREELEKDVMGLKRDMLELVIKIVERILNTELELHPEIINNIISGLLDEMSDFQKINIHVNPELSKYIVEEDFKTKYARKQLNFIADNGLELGDCIIETKLGGRDGTIETKLNLIKKELLKGAGYYEGS